VSEKRKVRTSSVKTDETSWLKGHSRLLSLVGALVVFVTFVAKEGIRERMKEVTDSIEGAENVFLAQTGSSIKSIAFADLARRMLVNQQNLERYTHPLVDKAQPGYNIFADRFVNERLELTWEAFQHVDTLVSNTSRLKRRLPERSTDIDDGFIFIRDNTAKLGASYKELRDNEEAEARPRGVNHATYLMQRFTQTVQLGAWSVQLADHAYELAEEVLEAADKAREKAERRYRMWTWISYGLYSLGWGLALAGTMYGIRASGAD
jgi:hypothetical protein